MKKEEKKKKYDAIEFFLKKYGLILNFYDDSYKKYNKKIPKNDSYTLKGWKEAVFENSAADIGILGEFAPANHTRFVNILSEYDAANLKNILKLLKTELVDTISEKKKIQNRELRLKSALKKEKHNKKFFPKEILEICIDEFVKQEKEVFDKFDSIFTKYINSIENDIEISDILKRLMKAHNTSALGLNRKNKELNSTKEQIKRKDQEINSLTKSVYEKENRLKQFGEDINRKNKEIDELKSKIKAIGNGELNG